MRQIAIAFIIVFFCACEFKANVNETDKSDKKDTATGTTGTTGKIKNGIIIKEEGLKVQQAFLLDQAGNLVSEKNLTKPNQQLRLRLILEPGFALKDGLVYVGGSEKVVTSEGDIIMDEKDLFANTGGISVEDSKVITFSVEINNVVKLVDFYEVQFRVWDKNSDKAVSGSYKFNVE